MRNNEFIDTPRRSRTEVIHTWNTCEFQPADAIWDIKTLYWDTAIILPEKIQLLWEYYVHVVENAPSSSYGFKPLF